MDVRLNDILVMKKNHPCGENRFLVLRIGMDFKLRCMGCGRNLCPRAAKLKNISKRSSAVSFRFIHKRNPE